MSSSRITISLCASVLIFAAACAESPHEPPTVPEPEVTEKTAAMDHLVTQMLEATDGNVPGISIAVVKGSDVVYLNGFGKADVENDVPVSPVTPFYIASSTKSFTALAVTMLDRDGVIELDAPMTDYAPEVPFAPEVRGDEVTIRHLLSHTSGLQNSAIVRRTAYTGDHSKQVLHDLLAATDASDDTDLGEFDYSNLGYVIASLFIDEQTGQRWQDVLAERLFEPAGMIHTTAYASEARAFGQPVAEPYLAFGAGGSAERAYLVKEDKTMHAAGGMYTTAVDAARWIEAQLNEGVIDGDQVFQPELIRSTHDQAAKVDAAYGDFLRDGYGLGWYRGSFDNDLAGERQIHHFGGFGGAHSHISFLPERQVGVAVFINESGIGGNLATSIASLAYRLWLEHENPTEEAEQFVEEIKSRVAQFGERVASDRASRANRPSTLTQAPEAYAGTFVNPLFGTAVVTVEESVLRVRIGNMVSVSTAGTEPDAIRVELIPMSGEFVRFEADDSGSVQSMTYNGYEFMREM